MNGLQLNINESILGLTLIVIDSANELGSSTLFLLIVIVGRVFHLGLGSLRVKTRGGFFPSLIIERVLVAVGMIINTFAENMTFGHIKGDRTKVSLLSIKNQYKRRTEVFVEDIKGNTSLMKVST